MSTLSTHVLDTAAGCPAKGMRLSLSNGDGGLIFEGETNADGRCPEMPKHLKPGPYRLDFQVADYFRTRGVSLPKPPFLDLVPIAFGVADEGGHYHVPLLVSPFAYSTYRGS
ncbi:hydroxyisourate hydrolase [Sphingobium sp. Ant17]|uniref:hydroxyisourate hydrolase n=1 Tax=Sphingobium sp. Ant17 TaxID=1461752 RepID=UPI00044BFE70|nr:hydroxyisourate hydrolase [Sphingobium sp. Ant17]EXS71210.1 5-hydroxyisourate hydrolase [Sphingobium sp. Ant17]